MVRGCYDILCLDNLPVISQHLARLELYGVQLLDNFLNFSSCPALQHVEFGRCELCCGMISSRSLKLLSIIDCKFVDMRRTRIYVPNLVSLRLDGFYRRVPVLDRVPLLVEAFVRVTHSTGCCVDNNGDLSDEHCDLCYGIKDGTNCLLLDGLSEAKTLSLIDEAKSVNLHVNSVIFSLYQLLDIDEDA
ncbi:hypothetical protein ABZP36_009593 [Zizania latifolia]